MQWLVNNPLACFHFVHAALLLFDISISNPSFCSIVAQRYQNILHWETKLFSKFSISSSPLPNLSLHLMRSVFDLLVLNPFDLKAILQRFSLSFACLIVWLVPAALSANNINDGLAFWILIINVYHSAEPPFIRHSSYTQNFVGSGSYFVRTTLWGSLGCMPIMRILGMVRSVYEYGMAKVSQYTDNHRCGFWGPKDKWWEQF